jgi:hypothetical protein
MTHKLAFAALSAVILLGATSATFAASKKSSTDPRSDYLAQKKGHDATWCDFDPNCNGWAKWADGVRAGKLKADERPLLGAASAP